MDLKVMPKSYQGHMLILCIIDNVLNYLFTIPTHQSRSEVIDDALLDNMISKCYIPDYIIIDQDRAFMLSPRHYLFKKFDINFETVAPYNHQSLQPENGIAFIFYNY